MDAISKVLNKVFAGIFLECSHRFRKGRGTQTFFARSSITINGWLRDFLWAQASQVIQSYGSSLSAYGLFFLGAHFVWAFSLMFLFSGRGYWQELIESIVWAHNKLKVAPATQLSP
jgi:hypothetical protein